MKLRNIRTVHDLNEDAFKAVIANYLGKKVDEICKCEIPQEFADFNTGGVNDAFLSDMKTFKVRPLLPFQ